MRYFTKTLWVGAQQYAGSAHDENYQQWQKAFREYQAQLDAMKNRLPANAYQFFSGADIHDGELLELRVADGSRPAPPGDPAQRWNSVGGHPVRAKLTVLDAYDLFVWYLEYRLVRRLVVDFPSDEPIFNHEAGGFGDWGYHELTDAGDGFMRHEVLFRSGATLLVEFRDIVVESVPARPQNS
jgi:hypothetical protein